VREWFVVLNEETRGPFAEEALREMAGKGVLTADSFVWNEAPENAAKGWQKAAHTEVAAVLAPLRQASEGLPKSEGQNFNPQAARPPLHAGQQNLMQYPETAANPDAYASRTGRLAAAIIDNALLYLPFVFLYSFLISSFDSDIGKFIALLLAVIIMEFAIVGFNIYFLVKNGQTIGKKLLHIKIVNLDGSKTSFSTLIFLRGLLTGILAVVPLFSIVDACFIFREDRRTLHDMIAGTIVVRQ
jgi:uncharacterized RDD family membrane protein YckC